MTTWRMAVGAAVGTLLFAGVAMAAGEAPPCDEASARLVARAYVLSNPLAGNGDALIQLMAENRAAFSEGGKAILCMQALGTGLTLRALVAQSQGGGYSATERFGGAMPQGLEHLPGQVDASMQSYNADVFTMGQELLWLSRVLPPAAKGDYQPYLSTATPVRQAVLQVLPVYQLLCGMDPGSCQVMQELFRQMASSLEQQIYTLARQLGQ